MKPKKPKIAIFDYNVTPESAMGGCHLKMLAGLSHRYEFTVFAMHFENPAPERIAFVRIPAPPRPTILLSLVYHVLAPIYYVAYRARHRTRFDLVEKMEVFTVLGEIAYIHFCYRAYLRKHWRHSKQPGVRGLLLALDHASRAYLLEPILYRLARKLVVPSNGLARELIESYPFTENKIQLLPNSADYHCLSCPGSCFDREGFRSSRGFQADDLVLVFIALGQFERKGLPELLRAIANVAKAHIKLLVVGGSSHWIQHYGARAEELSIGGRVSFVGMQRDVAPFLWAADAFALPSLYEVFPLVAIEAAAAGRAILVTRLNGVEDYLEHGRSALFVDRTVASISDGIRYLDSIGPEGRERMGGEAQRAAREYSLEAFVSRWDTFLAEQLAGEGYRFTSLEEEADHVTS